LQIGKEGGKKPLKVVTIDGKTLCWEYRPSIRDNTHMTQLYMTQCCWLDDSTNKNVKIGPIFVEMNEW